MLDVGTWSLMTLPRKPTGMVSRLIPANTYTQQCGRGSQGAIAYCRLEKGSSLRNPKHLSTQGFASGRVFVAPVGQIGPRTDSPGVIVDAMWNFECLFKKQIYYKRRETKHGLCTPVLVFQQKIIAL